MAKFTLVVASLLYAVYASPLLDVPMVLHEHLDSIPQGFIHAGPASEDSTLTLRLGLQQSNFAGLEDALYAVSTPGSARYGQHLSRSEVNTLVAPSSETVSEVQAWLASHNVSSTAATPAGDWLTITVSVKQANELLGADFSAFTHLETGEQAVRTLSYSIPASLQGHVKFVHPTVAFPVTPFGQPSFTKLTPSRLGARSPGAAPSSCNNIFNVSCVMELYDIPYALAPPTSNRLVVPGFIGEYANENNLAIFLNTFRPDLNNQTTFALETVDDGINPQDIAQAGAEAATESLGQLQNLDTQWTIGVASGVNVTFVSVGNNNLDGVSGFLDLIEYLLNDSDPLTVLSTSYSFNEASMPAPIAQSMCEAYAQLGAQGVSILFSSGDGGVAGGQAASCSTFQPTFPSTCPYITSVGATSGVAPETAASFSTGGFSGLFSAPSYQTAAVSSYLHTLGTTYSGLYNASGRAFPDVSAAGNNLEIVWQTEYGLVGGTSCSTPILASVVAMVNSELMAKGKSPLGFLNPFIYKNADAFTDVTTGDNPGCGTEGFSAGVGWDPVTGVGSPLYTKLLAAAGL
ncbi:family S53 protease [Amylostereum chailletii]|nr:family S53 protease [Amylostereum chailletii]